MARAYKCDRCGNYYDVRSSIRGKFVICQGNLIEADICPLCKAKFEAWFDAAKELKEEEDE